MRLARAPLALLLAFVVMTAGLVAAPSADRAEAATASDFNPGYIVSDDQFFNGLAMGGLEIQRFLDSQVRTCASGYTCLKDYQQSTPAMAESQYCNAMPGRTAQSAAAIVYHVGRACDISPRVLLVLVQKEQSLVTLTAPSSTRYERATGFACPDTAPCDSSFGGFFYQIYYAARQFQRYAAHPQNYQHRAGTTNNVLFHPDATCGRSPVAIRNQATAGLYNYTPYQPNAAALANLYGTGDACSAYGNRNFWRIWSDWFGSPTGIASLLARVDGTNEYYLIDGSEKHRFADNALVAEYSRLGSIQTVSREAINGQRDGGPVGRVLRASDGRTFFVDEGKRFQFESCAQMADWGYQCGGVTVGAPILNALQDPGKLKDVVGWDGAWWQVDGGARHEIGDPKVIGAAGLSYENSWMSPGALNHLPIGAPLLAPGYGVRNASSSEALMRGEGGTLLLDPAQSRLAVFAALPIVSDASVRAGAEGARSLPNRIDAGTAAWVLTDRGLVQVAKAAYGGDAFFTDMAQNMLTGIPVAANVVSREHFQAELGSTTVWWMHDGKRDPIPQAEVAAVAQQRGIPVTVFRGVRGYLNWIPEHSAFPAGTLVRDEISGQLLLTSSATTLRVDDARVLSAIGLDTEPIAISRSVRNGLPAVSAAIDDFGIRCSADMIGSYGRVHPVLDADARADWAQTHEQLPADVCALLTASSSPIGSVVRDSGGSLWLADDGTRRPIDSQQTVRSIGLAGQQQVVVDGRTLYSLDRAPMVPPYWYTGTVVRPWSQSQRYLVDQGRVLPTNSTVAWELGFRDGVTGVSHEAIQVSNQGSALPTTLVTSGGISYAAVDGRLVRFPWRVATHFGGAFTEVSSTMVSKAGVSDWMSQYIRHTDGGIWFVENGTRTLVSAAPAGQSVHTVDQTIFDAIPAR